MYLLTDPEIKRGYIVCDICTDIQKMGRYMAEYKMPVGELFRGEDWPGLYNLFWYIGRLYRGYKFEIVTK